MIESKLHIMATIIFPGNKRNVVVQMKTDFLGKNSLNSTNKKNETGCFKSKGKFWISSNLITIITH